MIRSGRLTDGAAIGFLQDASITTGAMLFLDGVYVDSVNGPATQFRWGKAPTSEELTELTRTIAWRIAHFLERQGLLERDGV